MRQGMLSKPTQISHSAPVQTAQTHQSFNVNFTGYLLQTWNTLIL